MFFRAHIVFSRRARGSFPRARQHRTKCFSARIDAYSIVSALAEDEESDDGDPVKEAFARLREQGKPMKHVGARAM